MTKGKSTWEYNKLLTARRNYFLGGGTIHGGVTTTLPPAKLPTYNEPKPATTTGGGGIGAAGFAAIGTQAAADIGKLINAIDSSDIKEKADSMINQASAGQMSTQTSNDNFDTLTSDWVTNANIPHVTAKQMGAKNAGQMFGSAFAAGNQGFAAGASTGNMWAAAGSAAASTGLDIIGNIIRNKKANKQAARVNQVIDYTRDFNERSLLNRAENLIDTQMSDLQATYAAYGGPINRYGKGGSIHIKPENRGKFTETKRRTGKTTEELTHSSNPLTRKRAIFAQNAKKWHHAFGGELNTQGGDFTNGLLYIDNGGSHEANPYEGVPMGMDPEGTPNLVEEGETIFNDYVFSRRLKVPKALRNKYKLGNVSFADASKKLAKESEERPNDPISMRGLEFFMNDLAAAQEALKAKNQKRQFAYGGKVNKFDGENTKTQQMYNFSPFLEALAGYTSSKIAGKTAGKYRPDPYIPMEGNPYMLGAKDIAALQELKEYQDFTEAMIANPNMDYIRALDAGVADGVPKLLDKDGNLVSNWADLYRNRRTDGVGGIYHWTPTIEAIQQAEEATPVTPAEKAAVEQAIQNRYYYNKGTVDKPNWVLLEGQDNAPLWMRNNKYRYSSENARTDGVKGTDYYYDVDLDLGRNKAEFLRYAPALGFGISALTDTLGLTNKPDYSNADALLNAVQGAGSYQPVRFKPIGNYLTYRPFDRDYYINKMNAEAGASRRMIANTSGGNRATAMAGILAADNNYLNQLGTLAKQAEEYNLAQRQQVEDFNRTTNTTNSQGFLQADMANQKALAEQKEFMLKGTQAVAEMRERERLATQQNKSANISGLFQTLGDIGFEAKNDNMTRRLIESGWAPGAEKVYRDKANGGKIKRKKKGLTY